jgi:hypothetical protein
MGMSQVVSFRPGQVPSWPKVRELLTAHKLQLQIRMIDGELAFPDEEPTEEWRELRLATPAGQAITARRNGDQVELVVWGNADQELLRARNALAWAFTQIGAGSIEAPEGSLKAAEFWKVADLPAEVRNAAPDLDNPT